MVETMAYAQTLEEAERLKRVFQASYRNHDCGQAADLIDRGWGNW